jgi:hypothetical protein
MRMSYVLAITLREQLDHAMLAAIGIDIHSKIPEPLMARRRPYLRSYAHPSGHVHATSPHLGKGQRS